MPRYGPGPVYVGRCRRWLHRHASWLGLVWWLALEPRKNQKPVKKQQVKGWGKGGNKPPHRGGLFGKKDKKK